ncbi:MAG TPA: DUF882 domain-containing protein [Synechococcales cyanobacterium M55_K2018_004]|nr:DUF882 domain-containing protein [Synechococcales cyanobacterium M55_K2018_004]
MGELTADQRNDYYLLEGARTGIHKSILAALYVAHGGPNLTDGETGLGISAANRIPANQVSTFPQQVQFAANTIRSITNRVTAQGWRGHDIWDIDRGRYTDRFLALVADGYVPPASDLAAARLEPTDAAKLKAAYLEDLTIDYKADGLPQNLAFLDNALLRFVERLGSYYQHLDYQREALLEAVRIWRKLDTRQAAIASFNVPAPPDATDESYLDPAVLDFMRRLTLNYSGFPHQREALLRLVQLWRELDSREEAIASLQSNDSAETNIQIIDPALVAFAQRVPQFYQGKGEQRHALTEAFRLWHGLDSRAAAVSALGVDPRSLTTAGSVALVDAARQLDRQLLEFIRRIPFTYDETEAQREALIRLVQLWRNLGTRDAAIRSLFDDLRRMVRARRDSQDAPPRPEPAPLPPRPARWTPTNIQLHAAIIPNGSFTWAEATHGGTRMPPNQATVDSIVRIARLAQQARDRLGRPFRITSWYRPPEINARVGGASHSRHMVGDAIDFYCDGLTGNQVYWALDPWWSGGLGRYRRFPNLVHIDARDYRARWRH